MYSQNAEEEIILEATEGLSRENRSVLDIGANDGVTLSNSLALIERGWNALLIEPSPFAFAKLLAKHWSNPKVKLLNAAVGVETRLTKFYDCEDPLYSTTLEAKVPKDMRFRDYYVPQVTIKIILEQLGCGVDVLSIDTEGTSFDVLQTCPLKSWCPKAIAVEHDSRVVEISGWARERGYRVHEVNAENVVLVRR